MTDSGPYIEANCQHCKSRGFRKPDGIWVHAWGSEECAERPKFIPDFMYNR